MAYAFAHLLLFLLPFLLPFSAVAQTNGNITVGASITAGDKATPWLSPSRDFAFGFKQSEDNNLFWLSIWYQQIPNQTIVWYANQSVPAPSQSKVELTNRGLVLKNPGGDELWRSESIIGEVDYGFMNDTGNFELVRGDSVKVWESFKYPADTLLPTQIMESGGVIYSRRSETNFSRGRFQLRLLPDGNLVLNTRDMATDFAYDAYYTSGTNDPSNSSNSGYQVIFNETGHMYILRRNGVRYYLTPQEIFPPTDYYHRATLNFDGVFAQYVYPKDPTDGSNWKPVWYEPDNICFDIGGDQGSGACGYNNVCTLNGDNRPVCECPAGYSLLDPDDKYGSCSPNFTQRCVEDDLNSSPEDPYGFEVLIDTDWPTSDYARLLPSSEELCRNSCMHDCFCSVAILRGDSCWKKKLPLSNGRKGSDVNGKAFLKLRKGDLPPESTPKTPRGPGRDKDRGTLILVGSVLLGSSLFVNFLLIGAFCLGFFLIYRKKIVKTQNGDRSKDPNLRCFSYKELEEATDGFKEELGRGGCGIVYKGVMQMGPSTNVVAVKKLDRVVQEREKEFKTEVNVIGRTHHKNLVRLLGFCDEGQHRILVYEFLSNGTLAGFLFGESKPNWNRRTEIALGIARGLLYLHEECSTQIIHCDIKPQNILLDDYYNARISDFGLAKLLMMNQSKTIATIRGTKGYVAPEWFNNKPITAKVDIYSFGVLLLEIITCRRNVADMENGGEEQAILTYWACDCYQDGKLDALVENDMEALNDWMKLERFLMVAIWCIQDDPSLRPTMRKVSQMLEGVVEVAHPPCPSQFSFTI